MCLIKTHPSRGGSNPTPAPASASCGRQSLPLTTGGGRDDASRHSDVTMSDALHSSGE